MSHPLDGCWAKVARANEHIEYLTADLQKFLDLSADRYRVKFEFNPETKQGCIKAFADGDIEPPLRYAVIIAEVIHQLRSSLDHLVWALVLRRHPNPSFKIAFPICESRQKFEKALKEGILKGISASSVTLIDAVQPYREPEPLKSALYLLQHLDNIEKHKIIIAAVGVVCLPNMIDIDPGIANITFTLPPPTTPFMVRPSKEGTEFFPFGLDRFDSSVRMNFNMPRTIAFEEVGPIKSEPVIARLARMRDATVTTINAFRSEFAPS